MITSLIVPGSQVIELSEKSFKTFCDDISGMFGVVMDCNLQQYAIETVQALKDHFKNLVVVYSVKAEGALNNNFQLILDRQGLFILAGVIGLHPEQMILENIKSGSLEKAEQISYTITEVGTALTGSFDRAFRKGLDGHSRLVHTSTFIGNPWDKPEQKLGLTNNEKFMFAPYEMTINNYPSFQCGVIFPPAIGAQTSQSDTEQAVSDDDSGNL